MTINPDANDMSKIAVALLSLLVLVMAVPQPAAAYVDPGSGAMIWQILAAALFGSLFRIKRITGWIRARFRKVEDFPSVR